MKESFIQRMIDPIKRKIALTIARAVVKIIDDGKALQRMQIEILKGELRDSVERFQDYGFTSHPHEGSEAVVGFLGGDRAHGIILKVDDRRYRLKALEKGEVAMYSDEGDKIVLKRNGQILVKAGTKVTVEAPDAEFTGNVEIKGHLHVEGDIRGDQDIEDEDGTMGEMRTIFNIHNHNENGDGGGITDEPNQQMS